MAQATLSQSVSRATNWVSVYVLAVALSLTTLGLVMLFSAGAVRGAEQLLIKQIVWVVLSLGLGLYVSFINLDWLGRKTWLVFGLCLVALALTLVPGIGVKVNGAQRWIGLGSLRVQPSEFALMR